MYITRQQSFPTYSRRYLCRPLQHPSECPRYTYTELDTSQLLRSEKGVPEQKRISPKVQINSQAYAPPPTRTISTPNEQEKGRQDTRTTLRMKHLGKTYRESVLATVVDAVHQLQELKALAGPACQVSDRVYYNDIDSLLLDKALPANMVVDDLGLFK
ncbi:hypothetical protein SeLEV6574_g07497 [Synchytrium endobioticum]|uniref:Uncharacterized protein n=1 Tax=Synchytrium endobioticum TaxID=286115 RepID=A0A507CD13_9FUNG|nr:hypothetical protein SeLEV6574_g07497 [Synchytrium endobioticum]